MADRLRHMNEKLRDSALGRQPARRSR